MKRLIAGFVAGLTLVIGCSGDPVIPTGPSPEPSAESVPTEGAASAVNVSDPITTTSLDSAAGSLLILDHTITFVSFPPGTFAGADSVQLANPARTVTRTEPLLNGGLDPTGIAADVGDVIEIVVFQHALPFEPIFVPVPPARPPVIVRTDPPRGQADVPMNSIIVIVFSEPVSDRSVNSANIRLRTGASTVSAVLQPRTGNLRAELDPLLNLDPDTEYVLEVSSEVADLSGQTLAADASIAFRTEDAPVTPDFFSTLDAGGAHTCGLRPSGQALCWGSNAEGQLGTGGLSTSLSLIPLAVDSEERFSAIAAGASHTCGLTDSGSIWCWGSGSNGELGTGGATSSPSPVEAAVPGAFVEVGAGDRFTCAINGSLQLFCWGHGEWGSIGNSATSDQTSPTLIGGPYVGLTVGASHACATKSDGPTHCWGRNMEGQVGVDTAQHLVSSPSLTDQERIFESSFALVDAASDKTCVTTPDRTEWGCWGDGAYVADPLDPSARCFVRETGTTVSFEVPCLTTVRPMTRSSDPQRVFTAIAGGESHACALTSTGEALCFGSNVYGQRGDGDVSVPRTRWPNLVADTRFDQVTAGAHHTCGISRAGLAVCWGRNDSGQLGNGNTALQRRPRFVETPP